MSKQKSNVSNLLAAIQRQPMATSAPKADVETPAQTSIPQIEPVRPASKAKPIPRISKSKMGQPVQFWLHDDDRRTIRELAAWLAGQGLRTSDSLVIRAVLRVAKTGGPLLEAYKEAASQDGRRKP